MLTLPGGCCSGRGHRFWSMNSQVYTPARGLVHNQGVRHTVRGSGTPSGGLVHLCCAIRGSGFIKLNNSPCSSDPAIKQYLKHIDETNGLGRK